MLYRLTALRHELSKNYLPADQLLRAYDLVPGLLAFQHRSLAKLITLLESTRAEHRRIGRALVQAMQALEPRQAYRIGITGVPGVGKSTFIDALGLLVRGQGLKLAVLAVDPTSPISHGSILGDSTRMTQLMADPSVFIRPSPSGLAYGGVTRSSRQSIAACEVFGFDVILVETVGVGQSEYSVHGMVDAFVTLMLPNAGDELQGVKKGLLEITDLVVVNKADGAFRAAAEQAVTQYHHSLGPSSIAGWQRPVLLTSAAEKKGLEEVWQALRGFQNLCQVNGAWQERRAAQRVSELGEALEEQWLLMQSQGDFASERKRLEEALAQDTVSLPEAVQGLMGKLSLPI